MGRFAWLVLSLVLAAGVVGCGDSGTNGSGGSAGNGGSGGTAGTGGSSTMVTISGTVSRASMDGNSVALEGATVSVVGTSNTATSDAQGNFSTMAPTGTVLLLTTADGNWGSLFAEDVPQGGLTGIEAEVIPDELVDAVAAALNLLTPPSTSKGLVAVVFDEDVAVGGETASIDVNEGGSFVFDDQEDPILSDTLVAGGGTEVVFLDVDVASSVNATATAANDSACPLEFPAASYFVQAKVLTEIDVFCPAQ